jgi:Tfp pilus assembly protein PilV
MTLIEVLVSALFVAVIAGAEISADQRHRS